MNVIATAINFELNSDYFNEMRNYKGQQGYINSNNNPYNNQAYDYPSNQFNQYQPQYQNVYQNAYKNIQYDDFTPDTNYGENLNNNNIYNANYLTSNNNSYFYNAEFQNFQEYGYTNRAVDASNPKAFYSYNYPNNASSQINYNYGESSINYQDNINCNVSNSNIAGFQYVNDKIISNYDYTNQNYSKNDNYNNTNDAFDTNFPNQSIENIPNSDETCGKKMSKEANAKQILNKENLESKAHEREFCNQNILDSNSYNHTILEPILPETGFPQDNLNEKEFLVSEKAERRIKEDCSQGNQEFLRNTFSHNEINNPEIANSQINTCLFLHQNDYLSMDLKEENLKLKLNNHVDNINSNFEEKKLKNIKNLYIEKSRAFRKELIEGMKKEKFNKVNFIEKEADKHSITSRNMLKRKKRRILKIKNKK